MVLNCKGMSCDSGGVSSRFKAAPITIGSYQGLNKRGNRLHQSNIWAKLTHNATKFTKYQNLSWGLWNWTLGLYIYIYNIHIIYTYILYTGISWGRPQCHFCFKDPFWGHHPPFGKQSFWWVRKCSQIRSDLTATDLSHGPFSSMIYPWFPKQVSIPLL